MRRSEEPVNWIDGSRADFDQNFIVARSRLLNLFILEDIRRTVVATDDCFHVDILVLLLSPPVSCGKEGSKAKSAGE